MFVYCEKCEQYIDVSIFSKLCPHNKKVSTGGFDKDGNFTEMRQFIVFKDLKDYINSRKGYIYPYHHK